MWNVFFLEGTDPVFTTTTEERAKVWMRARANETGNRLDNYSAYKDDTTKPAFGPEHYTKLNPEPADVIDSWNLNWRLASAVKYIARAGNKPGNTAEQDLEKAIRFIRREINAGNGKRSWD